jgi:hypothetical protein
MKSRKVRWVEHEAWKGETKNSYIILAGKPEVKERLGETWP